MIDIRLIRENPELVKENIKKKFQDEKLHFIEDVKKKDEEWRKLKFEADNLRKERNKVSEQINQSKKSKDNKKAEELIKKAKDIPIEIEKIEEKAVILEKEIRELMYQIPNIIHKSVPIGKDSSENVERKKIGKPLVPKYEILHHAEFAEKIGGVDFDTARETSGKGFFYLKGQLAILSSAMLNLAKDYMIKQGYEYIEPPLMIRKKVVEGVMSQKEIEDMMYKIEGEDLYLIATSEYPLVGMYMEKILQKSQIPQKITGFSPCFRKEIGAHGIEEKGFYRLHQFYKQEMVVICEPEDSYKFYDEMLKHTLSVMKALEIPVRVLECCSGDLADLKAKSCDVEAWSPRQKKYFEAGSLTNMEEAQARRLNIKINGAKGNYFAHTLNNTVLANPRTMIALMENHQQKDGSIKVPKALWKYTGFKKIQRK
ncbi:serine--tRNA ligase [Candidatus Pacearchaeota archaeon]|nr:serine--tRNA ligase [Candidatus Pacearchaeota archaeon]